MKRCPSLVTREKHNETPSHTEEDGYDCLNEKKIQEISIGKDVEKLDPP